MIFPLQMIRVLRVTGNHSKISSFTLVWICISSSSVMLIFILLNLLYPLPEAPLAISVYSISVLGNEEVDIRIKWISKEREREAGKERKRAKEEGREGGKQGWQARMGGEPLPHSNCNIPATKHALSFPVPRILFILFLYLKWPPSFPSIC